MCDRERERESVCVREREFVCDRERETGGDRERERERHVDEAARVVARALPSSSLIIVIRVCV